MPAETAAALAPGWDADLAELVDVVERLIADGDTERQGLPAV